MNDQCPIIVLPKYKTHIAIECLMKLLHSFIDPLSVPGKKLPRYANTDLKVPITQIIVLRVSAN